MSIENVTTALQAFATTGNGLTLTLRDARFVTFRVGPKTALAQSYGLGSRTLCNARPTFEAIITRRRSRRPIFQPKRQ